MTVFRPLIALILLQALLQAGCSAEPGPTAAAVDLPIDGQPVNQEDPAYTTSYAPVLKPAREAVVAVHSASIMRIIRQRGMDPREELLRRFFGLPQPRGGSQPEIEERKFAEGVGSGVLISADGYILTNNHVISSRDGEPADEILVELNGGREYPATLVGRDPQSDLAVLKIEGNELPHLPIADSGNLEVGDIVFAIGNPMGIGLTITQGIVSATGRSNLSILGDTGYESFIQTDAPINPGNSGGALVDAYGRLVGINTAILSRSGGSIGLGFAIPSTFARNIALDLIHQGEVRRGVLGVTVEDLTAEYAEAFDVPETEGAFVQSLEPGLPAERAGLEAGDVILALDDRPVAGATELRLMVAEYAPGDEVELKIRRGGELLRIELVLGDPDRPRGELLAGIRVALLEPGLRREYGLADELAGLVVTEVASDSPFAAGFAEGMVVLEINGRRPADLEAARDLLESRPVSRLYFYYEGRRGYLSIRP